MFPPPPMNPTICYKWKLHFKKAKPRNNLEVNTYSHYDYKLTNYNYNNYQKPLHNNKGYNIPPPPKKTNIICYICKKKGHKALQCQNQRQKDFCQNMITYSKGQTYFFALGYIVSDKSNLLVDCRLTEHVITNKLKFINFDQNFEPGNHFVEII